MMIEKDRKKSRYYYNKYDFTMPKSSNIGHDILGRNAFASIPISSRENE